MPFGCVDAGCDMSWLRELADTANDLLDQVDEQAANGLRRAESVPTKVDLSTRSRFESRTAATRSSDAANRVGETSANGQLDGFGEKAPRKAQHSEECSDAYNIEMDELRQTIKTNEGELRALREQVATLHGKEESMLDERKRYRTSTRQRIKSLERVNVQLTEELAASQRALERYRNDEKMVMSRPSIPSETSTAVAMYDAEVARMKSELRVAQDSLASERAHVTNLRVQIRTMSEQIGELEGTTYQWRVRAKEAETALNAAREDKAKIEESANTSAEKIVEARVREVASRLIEKQREIDSLRADVQALRKKRVSGTQRPFQTRTTKRNRRMVLLSSRFSPQLRKLLPSVVQGLDCVDRFAQVYGGLILQHPIARAFFVLYFSILHAYCVVYVLHFSGAFGGDITPEPRSFRGPPGSLSRSENINGR